MFLNIKPQTYHRSPSLLSQFAIMVGVWEHSIVKEVLQGEVVHEKNGGTMLLQRKWRTLLLLLRGEWENIVT